MDAAVSSQERVILAAVGWACPLRGGELARTEVSDLFGTREDNFMEDYFHRPGLGRWFQDDPSPLHLLCTLFLFL